MIALSTHVPIAYSHAKTVQSEYNQVRYGNMLSLISSVTLNLRRGKLTPD